MDVDPASPVLITFLITDALFARDLHISLTVVFIRYPWTLPIKSAIMFDSATFRCLRFAAAPGASRPSSWIPQPFLALGCISTAQNNTLKIIFKDIINIFSLKESL